MTGRVASCLYGRDPDDCSACQEAKAHVEGHSPSSGRRPFCNTWPYPSSDMDLVAEEDNDRVHKARGCCDGFLPRLPLTAPARTPSPPDYR